VIPATVKELSEDGAAIRQGMKVGDRIVSINGVAMKDWFDVVDVVQKSPEKLLNIAVDRKGQIVNLQVMPQGQRDNMGMYRACLV
jgi:regulator of sigma E protease